MTETNTVSFQFGLNHALPKGLTAAWGARLIFPADLLGDRQSFPGIETDAGQKLKHWLNQEKALSKALSFARKEAKNYRLESRDSETITLYEDETGIIVGNPQSSYGYLYVAAWLKEETQRKERCTRAYFEGLVNDGIANYIDSQGGSPAKWRPIVTAQLSDQYEIEEAR